MKAVVFDRFGPSEEVLHVVDLPVPHPGRGEVRVRMLASPINPSDLLHVRGEYGLRPQLPATAGFEGVGIVEESGGGLLARRVLHRRVAVINGHGGNWQEQVIIPARQAVPVASELSDEQAATFFVNPVSALVMTHYVLRVPSGAWLLQTAAGSALGRIVILLGKQFGFRTINVVRRREQVAELQRLGADAVICTADESMVERVQALTSGTGVPYALDAVGGTTGSDAARCLGAGGRMLVYGTLSEEPLSIGPRTLMAGQKRIEGFWLSQWAPKQNVLTMLGVFRRVNQLLRSGGVATEIGKVFPLDDVQAAAREAATPGHKGKVLLRISKESPG